MTLSQLIFTLAMIQRPFYGDTESFPEREARMTIVAEAIVDASDRATCQGSYKKDDCQRVWPGARKDLAVLLLAKAVHETNLAQRIHDGECRVEKGECDSARMQLPDGTVRRVPQSVSLWQMKKYGITDEEWAAIQTRDGTAVAAWHAARKLSSGMRQCGDVRGAISSYATGYGCTWSSAEPRLDTWRRMMNLSPEEATRRLERLRERKSVSP